MPEGWQAETRYIWAGGANSSHHLLPYWLLSAFPSCETRAGLGLAQDFGGFKEAAPSLAARLPLPLPRWGLGPREGWRASAPPLPRANPWPLPRWGTRLLALLSPRALSGWGGRGWAVVSCVGCLCLAQSARRLPGLPALSCFLVPPTSSPASPLGEGAARDWAVAFGGTPRQAMTAP